MTRKLYKVTLPGPLTGFTACDLNMEKFADFKQKCYDAGVLYGFGSKDPHPGSGVVDFTRIDCSGFVRTLLRYAGEGAFDDLPDGSWAQGDYFADKGFKPTEPANTMLSDDHIRVCIHHADYRDETGHIWLTMNGHTVESCGGIGPTERAPDAHLHSGYRLIDLATLCYVLQ